MRGDEREIIDLVLGCGRFRHAFVEDGSLFVAEGIDQLTALCIPSARAVMGLTRIDYKLALVVVSDLTQPLQSLKDSIASRKFVCLPKTVGTAHSLEMLAVDGRLSDWLGSEMHSDMHRYTLDRERALDLIQDGDDRFIRNLKSVFSDKFRGWIEERLAAIP